MKHLLCIGLFIPFAVFSTATKAQTNKDIQGTWRIVHTTMSGKDWTFDMDSVHQNLTKIITQGIVFFTIYNKQTDSLEITGQGKAITNGNQYIEMFEQSTDKDLMKEPVVYTYKVEGNILSYEGGTKDFHIVEVLKRVE